MRKIQPTVTDLKTKIFDELKNHGLSMDCFYSGNKSKGKLFQDPYYTRGYDKYAETLWNDVVKSCNYNPKSISKILNMREDDVQKILDVYLKRR